jgi:hypothetical protein
MTTSLTTTVTAQFNLEEYAKVAARAHKSAGVPFYDLDVSIRLPSLNAASSCADTERDSQHAFIECIQMHEWHTGAHHALEPLSTHRSILPRLPRQQRRAY